MTSVWSRTALIVLLALAGAAGLPASAIAQPAGGAGQTGEPGNRPRVTIYPLLVHAPIFGASIDLPGIAGDPNEQSGSTGFSLDGAWGYGVVVQADRWFGEFRGLWADVSAERVAPIIEVDTHTRLASGRGGVRLVGGLSATGGVRRISTELTFTLSGPNRTYTGTAQPVLWDPLIGVDWRSGPGRVRFNANFEGGGFGVGTDHEYSAEAHLDWELIPHVVLQAGYTFFQYKMTVADVTINSVKRTLASSQTLHGPVVGIGFTF